MQVNHAKKAFQNWQLQKLGTDKFKSFLLELLQNYETMHFDWLKLSLWITQL